MREFDKLLILTLPVFPQTNEMTLAPVKNHFQLIKVSISIYILIRETVLNEFRKADRYEVSFNSADLASGVYIYRMKVNDFVTSKKMVSVK